MRETVIGLTPAALATSAIVYRPVARLRLFPGSGLTLPEVVSLLLITGIYPRPTNGILVAMTVTNKAFASSGKSAM